MPDGSKHKKILVAPLNWGLGHAARCIPLIRALLLNNFEPILASDGAALEFLKKEFPLLKYYELPKYAVEYTKRGRRLKYKLLWQTPKILNAVSKERKVVEEIIKKEGIEGIISDNRFGVRSKNVPSVYITHQINVLSGSTSLLTTGLHKKIIGKFDECWIPDYDDEGRLAGDLSKRSNFSIPVKYLGPLSRFSEGKANKDIDVLAILSGPEPQRGLFEEMLREELKLFEGNSILVKGIIEEAQQTSEEGKLKVVNFMLGNELEETILRSKLVVSRSGYSSIMDLEALEAKAFFVPTPGQFEQEYLAERLKHMGIANYIQQNEFSFKQLSASGIYSGFEHKKTSKTNLNESLFDVFK